MAYSKKPSKLFSLTVSFDDYDDMLQQYFAAAKEGETALAEFCELRKTKVQEIMEHARQVETWIIKWRWTERYVIRPQIREEEYVPAPYLERVDRTTN